MDGDDPGFLRAEQSPAWQKRVQQFDAYFKDIEVKAKVVHVTLVVTLAPNRVLAVMISRNERQAGYDPYALDQKARDIVTGHGAYYARCDTRF